MKAKKTIIFYTENIYRGEETEFVQLAKGFTEAGYRTVIVTSEDKAAEFPIDKEVKRLHLKGSSLGKKALELRKHCLKEKASVLISFGLKCNKIGVYATCFSRTKSIALIGQDPMLEDLSKRERKKLKKIIGCSNALVFKTKKLKQTFKKRIQEKSEVIGNRIEDKFYIKEHRADARGKVITLGSLRAEKNHRLLIQAFSRVLKEFPDKELLIYGAGEKEEELRSLIEVLGLEENIKLMGITDRPEDVLAEAEIFVNSSDKEELACTLLEAMAIGAPIVSTDFEGVRDLITDGEEGILTEVGNEEQLAEAIKMVLYDENLRKKIGLNASERAFKYTPEKIQDSWESIVKNI